VPLNIVRKWCENVNINTAPVANQRQASSKLQAAYAVSIWRKKWPDCRMVGARR